MNFRTHEEMNSIYYKLHEKGVEKPYALRAIRGKQQLIYIGVEHFYNVEESQLPTLKDKWRDFVNHTEELRIVFTEGGTRPIAASEEDALANDGEAGLFTYWANKEGFEVKSPEPGEEEQREYLLKKFNPKEIMYHYFMRQLKQWRLQSDGSDFDKYFNRFFSYNIKMAPWLEEFASIESMKKFHKQKHDSDFDDIDDELLEQESSPAFSVVASALSSYRNQCIFDQIKEYWQKGYSIFAVFGSGHLIVMEPALRELAGAEEVSVDWGEL